MSPRYDRLIGSLSRVDGELAAELDQGTVLLAVSSSPKRSFSAPRRKPALSTRGLHRRPVEGTDASVASPSKQKRPTVLQQLEKAKTLRNLDEAKRRHARLVHSLSRLEEEVRSAVDEVEQSPRPGRQRIRDQRREHWAPDASLTPRQRKLLGHSRDIAPGTYATTAVCFKCGLPGHAGGECTKPTLGPKHLRATQVMLNQRKAAEPLPPGSTAPLHAAKSPRQPRLRQSRQAQVVVPETPPQVLVGKDEIEREIERLKAQLAHVVERETMYEAVEHLQSSLGALKRTAPMAQTHDDKWQEANLPNEYDDHHKRLAQADSGLDTGRDHNETIKQLHEVSMTAGARMTANEQRLSSPQLYNRSELGKSQPIEYIGAEFEHSDWSAGQDPGLQRPKGPAAIALEEAGYTQLQEDIQARLTRLKEVMAFPKIPMPEPEPQLEPEQEPEDELEHEQDVLRMSQRPKSSGVRKMVQAVFVHSAPLGLQLAPTDADGIVILAIDDTCGVNASALMGLRVGHELLKINGQPVDSWQFDEVIAELRTFNPKPDRPLVLDFGLTGLHLLPGAGACEDSDNGFEQSTLTGKHEIYRGALDESNGYDVAGNHGDAGLSLELGVDVRLAELEVTIDALVSKVTPASNVVSMLNHQECANSPELVQYRRDMYDASEFGQEPAGQYEGHISRPQYFATHLPGTRRPPQPLVSATHNQLAGSWGPEAAQKQSTVAEKRQLAAAAGKKTFRQYDPIVEGGIGFEGLLDAEGGPDRTFDIPSAFEEEKEDRWPVPRRSRQPVLKLPSNEKMQQLWDKHDYNGNGLLSQSEAKEVLKELWPALAKNSKVCDSLLRMAYKACDDGEGDGLVDRKEFPVMLGNVRYFNRMYGTFSEIDQSGDGVLDVNEFIKGCKNLHLNITDEDAEKEFELIDVDGGGIVNFLEFCAWVAKRKFTSQGAGKGITAAAMLFSGQQRTGAKDKESKEPAARGTKGRQAIQLVLMKQAERQQHSVCWICGQVGHVRTHCPNQDDETQLTSPAVSAELGLGTSNSTWNRQRLVKTHQDAFAKEAAQECAALRSIDDDRASVTP